MNDRGNAKSFDRMRGRKGVSPLVAIGILMAVAALVGAAGFVLLHSGFSEHTSTTSSCTPPTAPECQANATLRDGGPMQLVASVTLS